MAISLMDMSRCAVVLVDHQVRLMPIITDGERVISEAVCLAETAKLLGLPVIGTEQNPMKLGPLHREIRKSCDFVLSKMHFNACEDGIIETVRNAFGEGRKDIVIAGCETHVCLLQTAMGLIEEGFTIWLDASASGSRGVLDHDLALKRLERAGAHIVTTEMILFEWLRTCQHAHFGAVLTKIKSRYAPTVDSGISSFF